MKETEKEQMRRFLAVVGGEKFSRGVFPNATVGEMLWQAVTGKSVCICRRFYPVQRPPEIGMKLCVCREEYFAKDRDDRLFAAPDFARRGRNGISDKAELPPPAKLSGRIVNKFKGTCGFALFDSSSLSSNFFGSTGSSESE